MTQRSAKCFILTSLTRMSLVYPALPHGRVILPHLILYFFGFLVVISQGKSNKESIREAMTMRSRTRHDECPIRMQKDSVSGLVNS